MKKRYLIAIVFVYSLFLSIPAHAQDDGSSLSPTGRPFKAPPMRATIMQGREDNRELRKENVKERCEKVTAKISDITLKYNMGTGGRLTAFKAISERLKKVATNLKEKGLDTTNLSATITTLDTKIQTLETDYKKFIDALDNTKEHECGNSQGAFKNANLEARTIFQQVRLDIADIQKYLREDVKKALEALRLQKVSVTPTQ